MLSSLGQKADALAATGRACAIAQDLAASDPADIERRRELARVDHLHGVFLLDNSRVGEGLDALERARASQEDLIRSSPTDERFRLELAETCDDLAMQLASSGRRDEALAVYGRARELGEGLFRAKPADARIAHELVRTLGNMALALEGAGRQNEALAAYGRAREVLATMEDSNPTLLAVTRDRAWIDTITADVLIRTARDAEALPVLECGTEGPRDTGEGRPDRRPRPGAARPYQLPDRGDPRAGRPDVRGAGIVQAGGGSRIEGGRRSPR